MDDTIPPEECEDCPLDSDEFRELLDLDTLYIEAQDYLYEHEIGLDRWRAEPRPKLWAAIKFVHAETHRLREKKREDLKAAKDRANAALR